MWEDLEPCLESFGEAQQAYNRINEILATAPSCVGGVIKVCQESYMVDELCHAVKTLELFTISIHDEIAELIDIPYTTSLEPVISDVYDLSPENFKVESSHQGIEQNISLECLIVSTLTDYQLIRDFKDKSMHLDNDQISQNLLDVLQDAKKKAKEFEKTSALNKALKDLSNEEIQKYIDYIGEKYRGTDMFNLNNVNKLTDIERDLLIAGFEYLYPNKAKIMDDFLDPLSRGGDHDDDVNNIKYLSYTSLDPYHTIFFEYLPGIKIKNHHKDQDDQYCFINYIYIDADSFIRSAGNYSTFFHEIGHAIDSYMGGRGSGRLNNTIKNDVNTRIREVIELFYTPPLNEAQEQEVQKILDSLQKGEKEIGDPNLKSIRDTVQLIFSLRLNSYADKTASDVYGGVTGNNIVGMWSHSTSYWNWHKPSTEFFAHAFSSNMTGYTDEIDSISEYFPDASKEFTEMMEREYGFITKSE